MDVTEFIQISKNRIEQFLENYLPPSDPATRSLNVAMRYSVLNGGKRLRAAMIYALEGPLKVAPHLTDIIAAAVECIHAASLVHDDLPAMDDDDLRRNQAACHIKYGEATAILCGDALLMHGLNLILNIPEDCLAAQQTLMLAKRLNAITCVQGIMGGQYMDLNPSHQKQNLAAIEEIYKRKTCSLLGIGLELMVLSSSQFTSNLLNDIKTYYTHLGLGYQIQDDILDFEQPTHVSGKPQFSDQAINKKTIIAVLGIEKAQARMDYHFSKADDILGKQLPQFEQLHALSQYIKLRS